MNTTQQTKSLTFKCLSLNTIYESQRLPIEIKSKDLNYFDVQGNIISLNLGGIWTRIQVGPQFSGVRHFTTKVIITKNKYIRFYFISADEVTSSKQHETLESYISYYIINGQIQSKVPPRHKQRKIEPGQTVHSICDTNNGVITFILDSTMEVIGQAKILDKFKGRPMVPYVYMHTSGDKVEIVS